MITFEVDGVPICSWLDFEDDSENMKGDFDMFRDNLQKDWLIKHLNFGYEPENDAKTTSTMSYRDYKKKSKEENMTLNIKKVIFNGIVTIVFWSDNTKTVVRCGVKDYYDTEKGLAMAIAKKFLGNKGSYYETFKKWIPNVDEVAVCKDCKFADSPETGDGPCDKCSFSKDHPVGSKFVKAEN